MSTTVRRPVRDIAVIELVSGVVATCDPLDTLRQAANTLADDLIGVLLVGRTTAPLGVLSERDLTRAIAEDLDLDQARARDVMTEHVVTVPSTAGVTAVARQMLTDEIRHVAVRGEDDDIVGIVSIRQVLATVLD